MFFFLKNGRLQTRRIFRCHSVQLRRWVTVFITCYICHINFFILSIHVCRSARSGHWVRRLSHRRASASRSRLVARAYRQDWRVSDRYRACRICSHRRCLRPVALALVYPVVRIKSWHRKVRRVRRVVRHREIKLVPLRRRATTEDQHLTTMIAILTRPLDPRIPKDQRLRKDDPTDVSTFLTLSIYLSHSIRTRVNLQYTMSPLLLRSILRWQ